MEKLAPAEKPLHIITLLSHDHALLNNLGKNPLLLITDGSSKHQNGSNESSTIPRAIIDFL